MNRSQISAELRQFFAEEVRNDPNATLQAAHWHLRDFYERGPEDPAIEGVVAQMAETEELLATHGEHATLVEFL